MKFICILVAFICSIIVVIIATEQVYSGGEYTEGHTKKSNVSSNFNCETVPIHKPTLYNFRITLVTYAEPQDSIFSVTQKLLNETAKSMGQIDEIITWNWAKLQGSAF